MVECLRRIPRVTACLCLLLIGLACYRLSLIETGHFFWGDERFYVPASDLVDALARGDARTALNCLYETRGGSTAVRPAFLLVSTLPVVAQRSVGALTDISRETLQYYDAASAFNVLVTLGITVCVFGIARLWTGSSWLGLLTAVVYSLLCNANIWIRHMVAYQDSLLLFLIALWLISCEPRSKSRGTLRMAVAGALTALGFGCYPGHYAFAVINGAVALARNRHRLRSVAAFATTSIAGLVIFELLARFVGRSYFHDLGLLSTAITMGDYKEGYVFLWRYLRDVEGVVGVVLFVLSCGFAVFALWRRKVPMPLSMRTGLIVAILCYLFHASMGVLAGKMVFYGRVMMIYLPFVVVGAVLALSHLRPLGLRRAGVCALLAASVYSFVSFAVPYSRIVYPADFLQETMAGLGRDNAYPPYALWGFADGDRSETVEWHDPELVTVTDSRPDGSDVFTLLASHDSLRENRPRFIGVNLKFMWYIKGKYDRFTPPEGYVLVAEAPHPLLFPATGYEGSKPWERSRIQQRQYTMRIYQRMADDARPRALSPT